MSTLGEGGEEAAEAGAGDSEEAEASGHPPGAEAGVVAATLGIKEERREEGLSRRLQRLEPLHLLDIRYVSLLNSCCSKYNPYRVSARKSNSQICSLESRRLGLQ